MAYTPKSQRPPFAEGGRRELLVRGKRVVTIEIKDDVCILRQIPPALLLKDVGIERAYVVAEFSEIVEKCIEIRLESADGELLAQYWKSKPH